MAENQHRDKMVDQDGLNSQYKPRVQKMKEWNIQDIQGPVGQIKQVRHSWHEEQICAVQGNNVDNT